MWEIIFLIIVAILFLSLIGVLIHNKILDNRFRTIYYMEDEEIIDEVANAMQDAVIHANKQIEYDIKKHKKKKKE